MQNNEEIVLRELFDKIYDDAYQFVRSKLITKMVLLESMYIRQCIDLLQGLFLSVEANGNNSILSLSPSLFHTYTHARARARIYAMPLHIYMQIIFLSFLILKLSFYLLKLYYQTVIWKNFSYFQ
jgi:hypothetical protein